MDNKFFVLLVEDEERIAKIETAFLEHAGYIVLHIDDGQKALETISRFSPDIIVLDRMLPGKDGLTLCQEIRQISNIPIIMVTAMQEEQDRLDGFTAGVDDYLCKPFNPKELVARVSAILARTVSQSQNKHIFLEAKTMELIIKGKSIELTRLEYRILNLLMKNSGLVVDRQNILDNCFDDKNTEIFDRTIDNHIKNLRKKIAKIDDSQEYIRSVYGVGYVFKLA